MINMTLYEVITVSGIMLFLLGAWYQAFTFGWNSRKDMDKKTDTMMIAGFLIIILGIVLLILQ